jgi:hypothetical protein
MAQDLDQILLLIGAVLGGGFSLILLLAWLEPPRAIGTPVPTPVLDPAPVVEQAA